MSTKDKFAGISRLYKSLEKKSPARNMVFPKEIMVICYDTLYSDYFI